MYYYYFLTMQFSDSNVVSRKFICGVIDWLSTGFGMCCEVDS